MKSVVKTVAISLAFGDIYQSAGSGVLKKPLDGAIARFNAVTAGRAPDENILVICTAGYSKKFPLLPQPERQVSLAGQIRRYVQEYKPQWLLRLVTRPLCWSTRNEVRVGIKVALRDQFVRKDEKVVLRIVSNAGHLLRIRMYALLYTPKKWKIKLVRASHPFPLREYVLEFFKIVRDLRYIMRVSNRLRRRRN